MFIHGFLQNFGNLCNSRGGITSRSYAFRVVASVPASKTKITEDGRVVLKNDEN